MVCRHAVFLFWVGLILEMVFSDYLQAGLGRLRVLSWEAIVSIASSFQIGLGRGGNGTMAAPCRSLISRRGKLASFIVDSRRSGVGFVPGKRGFGRDDCVDRGAGEVGAG